MGREVAKALLIDAVAGWNRKDDVSHSIGYGVVPKHISDIMKSPNDEIRFILTGASEEYETYTYNLPVPIVDNAHPFYARISIWSSCNIEGNEWRKSYWRFLSRLCLKTIWELPSVLWK